MFVQSVDPEVRRVVGMQFWRTPYEARPELHSRMCVMRALDVLRRDLLGFQVPEVFFRA